WGFVWTCLPGTRARRIRFSSNCTLGSECEQSVLWHRCGWDLHSIIVWRPTMRLVLRLLVIAAWLLISLSAAYDGFTVWQGDAGEFPGETITSERQVSRAAPKAKPASAAAPPAGL